MTHIAGNPNAGIALIQPVAAEHADTVFTEKAIADHTVDPQSFCIAAVPVNDWTYDLTPWEAPGTFPPPARTGGARSTLERIRDEILPQLHGGLLVICGYSLAGLFALWAARETDLFEGAVAGSPSLWYPGWSEYADTHPYQGKVAYLSLGTKEEKARHPLYAQVGDAVRNEKRALDAAGVRTELEWNPGNHFSDPAGRMAKGMISLLKTLLH